MRLAGAAAKIVMQKWSTNLMKILQENKIEVHLAACYVDDARFLTPVLKRGWRWEKKEKKFKYEEKWKQNDEIEQLDDNVRHAREIKNAMNSIMTDIQFETELPEDFASRRLPTLDFEMWLEETVEYPMLPTDAPGVRPGPALEETDEYSRLPTDASGVHPGSALEETKEYLRLPTDGPVPPKTTKMRRPKIAYSFYEKPMSSPFSVMERSAQPENTKNSTLAQELIRRMLNTSEMIPQEERNVVVEKFILRLRRSGYNKDQVRNIIISGLKGYQTKKERAKLNNKMLHRSATSTKVQRHKNKLLEKSTWFKKVKKNDDNDPTNEKPPYRMKGTENKSNKLGLSRVPITVLFVPRTKGGELASRIRKAETELENVTGYRVKIVERSGTMIKRMVVKSNPWAGGPCGAPECLVCKHENGGGDCKKRSVTYRTRCKTCFESGVKRGEKLEKVYIGESSRTGRERGAEHANDYLKAAPDSHMWKHWQTDHQEETEKPVFSMKILRRHKSAFVRQINEAVLIDMHSSNVLNSKSEYNRCQIPRLNVKMGERDSDNGEKPAQTMSDTEIDQILTGTGEEKKRAGEEELKGLPSRKRRKVRCKKLDKTIPKKRDRQTDIMEIMTGMPRKRIRKDGHLDSISASKDNQKLEFIEERKNQNFIEKIAVRKLGGNLPENKANLTETEVPPLASPPPPLPAREKIKVFSIFQFKANSSVSQKRPCPPPPKPKKTESSMKQSNLANYNYMKISQHFKPKIIIPPIKPQISEDQLKLSPTNSAI